MSLIVPTVQNVREEIETVKNPEVKMWLKCLNVFCARSVEFAGKSCTNEKAYGTEGKNFAWLGEYQPQNIDATQLAMAMAESQDFSTLRNQLRNLMAPVKIAIFKIPIAKKHLLEGEPIIYRWAARPWDKKYDPWVQEIYEYYQQRGNEKLFLNNRKYYLDYLRSRGIFKKFCYPVERYSIQVKQGILSVVPESDDPLVKFKKNEKTGIISQYTTIPKHFHPFKQHGIRHVITGDFISYYKIKETLTLCSLVGWAPRSGPETMIGRYGNIYEQYESYLPLLLKQRYENF